MAQFIDGGSLGPVTPFNPFEGREAVNVYGMTEEEWGIYQSDPDLFWDLLHPLNNNKYSLEGYNNSLKEVCAKSDDLHYAGEGDPYTLKRTEELRKVGS